MANGINDSSTSGRNVTQDIWVFEVDCWVFDWVAWIEQHLSLSVELNRFWWLIDSSWFLDERLVIHLLCDDSGVLFDHVFYVSHLEDGSRSPRDGWEQCLTNHKNIILNLEKVSHCEQLGLFLQLVVEADVGCRFTVVRHDSYRTVMCKEIIIFEVVARHVQ